MNKKKRGDKEEKNKNKIQEMTRDKIKKDTNQIYISNTETLNVEP